MAKNETVITLAPYSEKDLQTAKDLLNEYIVKKVLEYIRGNYPKEERACILDKYIEVISNNINKIH